MCYSSAYISSSQSCVCNKMKLSRRTCKKRKGTSTFRIQSRGAGKQVKEEIYESQWRKHFKRKDEAHYVTYHRSQQLDSHWWPLPVLEAEDLKLKWIWQWVGDEEYFNAGYFKKQKLWFQRSCPTIKKKKTYNVEYVLMALFEQAVSQAFQL